MFRVFYDCACFKMHIEVSFFRPFQQFLLLNISQFTEIKRNSTFVLNFFANFAIMKEGTLKCSSLE